MHGLPAFSLTLAYLIPIALLAAFLGAERTRPRWLIAAMLIALPVFYIAHYISIGAIQGWPSNAPLPEEFRLLAFRIEEPSPRDDGPGEILLWVQGHDVPDPRVHRLDYSKELHEELVAAGRRQAEGAPQVGTRSSRHRAADTPGGERTAIGFRDEQREGLPPKDARP
jgi:4-amino-4-deoxy-L-arabinose transferase-like glycosyltransferase